MSDQRESITILMAEDDPDDRLLTRDALRQARLVNDLRFVEDGEQLMDYLRQRNQFADPLNAPRPGIILLDLNMPRKDGREALKEIKADTALRQIPVIVLTTSRSDQDIFRSYDLGANSFITKPVTIDGLIEVLTSLGKYWLDIVELPPGREPGR